MKSVQLTLGKFDYKLVQTQQERWQGMPPSPRCVGDEMAAMQRANGRESAEAFEMGFQWLLSPGLRLH